MTHRARRTSFHPNCRRKLLAAAVMAACVTGGAERAAAGPSVVELSTLDGTNGFTLNGVAGGDLSGISVSDAGDVNGDNIDDLIIGARAADPNGPNSGQSYVVFGSSTGFGGATLDLATLNGVNGFALNGVATGDQSGFSVSGAGDVNGDGIDDLIIGAYQADPNTNNASGQSHVVFGSSAFGATLDLVTLNGTDGFTLNGVAAGDRSGRSVSGAGDVNGDGIDDLIIGAYGADPNTNNASGQSYVVFGSSSFGSTLDLATLNGANGFALNGVAGNDNSGFSVSGAGDVNGDGIDDLIIGAPFADPNGNESGQSYVVFGGTAPFSATLNLATLNGTDGLALNGIAGNDYSGISVSGAGDINDDGIDDLIIGAFGADPNGFSSGQSYVVFGGNTAFDSGTLDLATLNGADGFALNGVAASDRSGTSVSGAGDVNGDGIDDLIIGANGADLGAGNDNAGQSYVVFGGTAPFSATLDLATLNGANGFALNGVAGDDQSGLSVSGAGDINDDGIDDLIIGALNADPNGLNSGQSYVVFGVSSVTAPEPSSASLLAAGLSLLGLSWRRRRQANTLTPSQASDNTST